MSFQQGLSGLNAAARNIEVIGNNIANASTVGFKESRAQFADVYAASLSGGVGSAQAGIGVRVNDVAQQFSQGNISSTDNPMDVAIQGNGFFRLLQNGGVVYSRNGQFQVDRNNNIVNADGFQLTGFPADPVTGVISPASTPTPLRLSTADINPSTTTTASVVANLDSRSTTPVPAFSFIDPTSYNNATNVQVFDSLGNPHNLSLYFRRSAANSWEVRGQLDGVALAGGAPIGTGLNFTTGGAIDTAATTLPFNLVLPIAGGAATPQAMTLNFNGTTQYGSAYGITNVTQDGYTSGRLVGYSISNDGVIQGRFSNGQMRAQGQIVMASFNNPQGLQPLGSNVWSESSDSGSPAVGVARSGSLGTLQSSAVEESNIDLSSELVELIVAQRVFQANAQTIRTQDALLQTIVQLR